MKKLFLFVLSICLTNVALANCREQISSTLIIDPTDQQEWSVTQKSYLTNKSESYVFIVSPIVGETFLDRRIAQKLCANGMSAIIAGLVKEDNPLTADKDLNIHNHSYTRALAGIQAVMNEILMTKPNARFGILGMSLGGLLSAYIAGSDERIVATVLVATGGNVAGILADSDQEIAKAQRERRMSLFNLSSPKEYEDLLRGVVTNDPLNVAGNIKPNSTYLFIANSDTTVPTKYQRELRDAIPSPLVYAMNAGHVSAIVRTGTLHASKIVGFFKRRL